MPPKGVKAGAHERVSLSEDLKKVLAAPKSIFESVVIVDKGADLTDSDKRKRLPC